MDSMQKLSRILIAIISFTFFLTLSLTASVIFLGFGPGILFGIGLFLVAISLCVRCFLVSVPEVTGLVTINVFTGDLYSYGPGLHFRYPWEQVKEDNYINIRVVKPPQKEDSYPSKDGPAIPVKWEFQYRPIARHLDRYIAVGQSTITEGLVDIGSSFLSKEIAKIEALKAKSKQENLERKLQEAFKNDKTILDYGIEIVKLALIDVDYEQRFQQARATEQIAERLRDAAKKIVEDSKDEKGQPKISMKEAMNMVLVMNKDVTKDIQETEGGDASLLMAAARNVGARGGKK